jgi:hypothetical protein
MGSDGISLVFQKSLFFMMNLLSPPTADAGLLFPLPLLDVLDRFFNVDDLL